MKNAPTAPLALLMLGAVHEMEARLESALGQAGLSLAKFGVLARLSEAGEPLALSCLADLCSCVRSNMTQLVDRLETDKLVERIDDPSDRRSIKAALTPQGRSRYEEGARLLDEAESEVFARLTDPERATLTRLLHNLQQSA